MDKIVYEIRQKLIDNSEFFPRRIRNFASLLPIGMNKNVNQCGWFWIENILRTLLKFIIMNEIFYHILISKERSRGFFDLKFYKMIIK